MRISDWSSDVCSSDLTAVALSAITGPAASHARVRARRPAGAGERTGVARRRADRVESTLSDHQQPDRSRGALSPRGGRPARSAGYITEHGRGDRARALSFRRARPALMATLTGPALIADDEGGFALDEIAVEPPGPGAVRVRVTAAGLFHTDPAPLHWPGPPVIGHEGARSGESIGDAVPGPEPGQPVV